LVGRRWQLCSGPGLAGPTRPKDMSTALSMATGLSGGAAATIPAIFFGLSFNALKPGKDAAFKPDADIEGDACYVIGEKTGTVGVTIWISKKSKLLRQIRDDFNGPTKMPEMTDEETRKVLESMGWATTAEAIKNMKAQMTSMRSMMSLGNVRFQCPGSAANCGELELAQGQFHAAASSCEPVTLN
jgi:hypothetical protein